MAAAAAPSATVGPRNDLTDVEGLRVGHAQRLGRGWRTGTTVILATRHRRRRRRPGRRSRHARPMRWLRGTWSPTSTPCLTGGSAHGLAAVDGVMRWLEERGTGYQIGDDPERVVPIVPAAVLFDLGRGGVFRHRPDAGFGWSAAVAAGRGRRSRLGRRRSARTGAAAGGVAGGIGSASAVLPDGTTVAALVAVNAAGAVFDAETGVLHAAPLLHRTADPRLRRPTRGDVGAALPRWRRRRR